MAINDIRKQAIFNNFINKDEEQTEEMNKAVETDLEKGKSFPIGTVHNGYKKVAEGKWQKVSKHGMTKKDHEEKAKHYDKVGRHIEYGKYQREQASELNDKEYDDAHVMDSEEDNKDDEGYDKRSHYENLTEDALKREFEDKTGEDSEEHTVEQMIDKLSKSEHYEVFTEDSILQFHTDINKALESGEITEDDFEKAMKDVSHLEKKIITNKAGVQQTVYVRHHDDGAKHEFTHGDHVSFEHKGKQVTGKIHGLKHDAKWDKFGTAHIKDEAGNTYAKSLRNLQHSQGNKQMDAHVKALEEGATEVEADRIANGYLNKDDHSGNKRYEYGRVAMSIGGKEYTLRDSVLSDSDIDFAKQSIEQGLFSRIKTMPEDDTKVPIEPSGEYSVSQFSKSLSKVSSDNAKKKFFKEKQKESEYSYAKYNEEDLKNLAMAIGDDNNLYNFFNKNYEPTDITTKKIGSFKEEVKSNNIYDKMAAKSYDVEEISFKVKVGWKTEPITVKRRVLYNSTLSMRDIVSFM